jgi:AhpD family alkylhydroperoxidase
MARLCYATEAQLRELIRQSGLPQNAPPANAFRMFAHAPAGGAATLRLVFALLTETDLDPKLRELVILQAAQRCDCRDAWVQHVAIARGVGVEEAQIAALECGETPPTLFDERVSKASCSLMRFWRTAVLPTIHSPSCEICSRRAKLLSSCC